VLRVRPLDTLFTNFDEPFIVDIESDTAGSIDVYIDGAATPYTTLTVGTPITRATVWNTNPIASTPDNDIHRITFKSQMTNERADVYIAYYGTGIERLEFQPSRGSNLMGYVNQIMFIGDRAFTRRLNVRRIAPINAPDDSRVFHEFMGFNELGDKFYYVIRQDRFLLEYAGATDAELTLRPVTNIPVTVDYSIPDIPLAGLLSHTSKSLSLINNFISWAGGGSTLEYMTRFKIGIARAISRVIGINQEIVNVQVVSNRLRVTYVVDAPPLSIVALYGLAIIAGSFLAYKLINTIRDVVIEREQAIQAVELFNAIRAINEERTKAIEKVLEYAEDQGLSPDQTLELLNVISDKYNTTDLLKAAEALKERDKYKSEAESLRNDRYLWALGGAAVGAIVTAAVKR
jgi:hypothetical protein